MTADRIDAVVYLAVKNQMHPYKNSFPAFVKQIHAAKFQTSPIIAQIETKLLNTAWQTDRWQSIIENLPALTKEEIELWEQSYKRVSCIL